MNDANKIIGIICHGGLIAISAGIVRGRRVIQGTVVAVLRIIRRGIEGIHAGLRC